MLKVIAESEHDGTTTAFQVHTTEAPSAETLGAYVGYMLNTLEPFVSGAGNEFFTGLLSTVVEPSRWGLPSESVP